MSAVQASWWFHRPVMYRIHDASDRLVYVGASHLLPMRMQQHAERSWWHSLAARVSWEFHATKEAAHAAEAVAIQEEQPVFNIRGAGRAEDDFSHWTADDLRICREWIGEDRNRHGLISSYLRDYLIPDGHRYVLDPNRVHGRRAAGISTAA